VDRRLDVARWRRVSGWPIRRARALALRGEDQQHDGHRDPPENGDAPTGLACRLLPPLRLRVDLPIYVFPALGANPAIKIFR
jgi:hypothetical protein